jgi:roadblock/LC7 domain-containing protein
MSTSEFDQLIAQDGILIAGRFGPGWTVTDHKCTGLFVESPAALQMARSFCSAITMVFNSPACAEDSITRTGFDASSWLPQQGWAFAGRRLLDSRARREVRHRGKQENPE